jgi:hypothetical protein
MFEIEKNIPIPCGVGKGRAKGALRLSMEQMEVGDSIVVSEKTRQGIHQIATTIGIKYTTRTICKKENKVRVWRTK